MSKNVDCHRQRLFCELSESKGSNQLEINRNPEVNEFNVNHGWRNTPRR